jgi:hypothetical protein
VEVVDVIAASFHYISTIQVRAGPWMVEIGCPSAIEIAHWRRVVFSKRIDHRSLGNKQPRSFFYHTWSIWLRSDEQTERCLECTQLKWAPIDSVFIWK